MPYSAHHYHLSLFRCTMSVNAMSDTIIVLLQTNKVYRHVAHNSVYRSRQMSAVVVEDINSNKHPNSSKYCRENSR
jgi:hypothetical protein